MASRSARLALGRLEEDAQRRMSPNRSESYAGVAGPAVVGPSGEGIGREPCEPEWATNRPQLKRIFRLEGSKKMLEIAGASCTLAIVWKLATK